MGNTNKVFRKRILNVIRKVAFVSTNPYERRHHLASDGAAEDPLLRKRD